VEEWKDMKAHCQMLEMWVNPPTSRRTFLKAAGITGAATVLEMALGNPVGRWVKEVIAPDLEPIHFGKDILWVDRDGLPRKVSTSQGELMELDRRLMQESRDRVLNRKEVEVAAVFGVWKEEWLPQVKMGGREHPQLKELPEDVLSEEELKTRRVEIYQDDSPTKLHIRASAFEPGMPLDFLAKEGRQLVIAMVNGPILLGRYVTDERLQDVIYNLDFGKVRLRGGEEVEATPETARLILAQKLSDIDNRIKEIRNQVGVGVWQGKKEGVRQGEEALLVTKIEKAALEQRVYTDEDLLLRNSVIRWGANGWYEGRPYRLGGKDLIFIAAGSRPERDLLSVYFDEEGEASLRRVKETGLDYHNSLKTMAATTHPNPAEIELKRLMGSAIRHEINHAEFDGSVESYQLDQNIHHEMDPHTTREIQEAWDRWERSDFGRQDPLGDKGYCFVFETNEGLVLT
jgi:hypothetical protein